MPRAKTPRNGESTSKQVITMPESPSQIRKTAFSASAVPADLESQIRQRAYELYQQRGCTPGRETDDWFQAEREILARQSHLQRA